MKEKESFSELYFFRNNEQFVKRHLLDYVLFHVYSKVVLERITSQWDELPFYVKEEIPPLIRQKAFSGKSKDTEDFLSKYWLKNAVHILSAYQKAAVPFSTDLRTNVRVFNLLSEKGEKELLKLKETLEQGKTGEEITLQAMKASNKFLLDISLFKNFNALKKTIYYSRPQFGRIILSASSGCYNMCSHCGFSAKAPVSHMPYPILIQLAHLFGKQLRSPYSGIAQIYSDSDPISYKDPIIKADIGDVCRYFRMMLPEKERLFTPIVTKGVLISSDDRALAKAFEFNSVSLSYVDLPGEKNIEKNRQRIQRSLSALMAVSAERRNENIIDFRHICLPDNPLKQKDFELPDYAYFQKIYPSFQGRWVQTFFSENLPSNCKGETGGFSAQTNVIIRSDGGIYECSPSPHKLYFSWVEKSTIFKFIEKEKT